MATNESTTRTHAGRISREFSALSFLWRLLFAQFLVLATYNPSGYSVFHWIRADLGSDGIGAIHFFVAILLLAGWSMLWIATWRSLDTFGVVIAALAIGILVWLLIDLGILRADSATALSWLVLVGVATLLAIGLSWSHVWRRITGQYEVDTD